MADIKELQEKLAAAEAAAADAKTEAESLRAKFGKNDNTGRPIPGEITVELETPSGKKEKKKLRFQPGYVRCRLKNGQLVNSEHLMALATGRKLSSEELALSPALAGMSSADAEEWLSHLARIRVSFLVPA